MGEGKSYKVVIAKPAKRRYQESVLPYLFDNFSFERAIEIDDNIISTVQTLNHNPHRGRIEIYLEETKEDFRFILHKETKHFELKIIYYVSEENDTIYVTDFFPTKMSPLNINENY